MSDFSKNKFREMRRKNQLLSQNECIEILKRGTSGVLALDGDNGYPYAVPISYIYYDGKIYFHCAKSGHKLDAVRRNNKASFCVTALDHVVPEEYTTYFRSVIAFGKMSIVKNEKEILESIDRLAARYAPKDSAEGRRAAIEKEYNALCMLRMDIEHISGKEAKELVNSK